MHRIIMLCGMMAFCITIQAQCPPASPLPTPYYENFDTLPAGETGSFANCWTATTTSAPNWKSEIGQTSSLNTGPSTDYSGSMAYVYLETTGGGLGDTSGFISPIINLTGLANPELNFYYHMYGADMGILQVLIWNGTTWTTEWTRTGEQHTSLSDPWSKGVVSLASYSGSIRIKFLGTRGADFTSDMAIDEISVGEAPACPQPTGIAVSNFTPTTADVNWNAVTPAINGYEIIYDTTGFDPALTGTSVSAVANSTSLSGLSSATDYDLYIISDCGATDGISDTTGPISFTTLCGTYTAPYFNDFENDGLDVPPLCWAEYSTYSGAWVEVENGSGVPYKGDQGLYLYSSSSDTGGDDTLYAITPQFTDLPVGDKQIRFFANSDDSLDMLIVGTMASPIGTSTFHAIDTIEFPTSDAYREVIVELTTAKGYNGTDEYIVLAHNLGVTTDYVRIDNFNYEVIPDCPKVLNTVLDTVTDISAIFSFESTGTTFNYEWGPAGYTFGQGTATTGTATTNPFTINGLQPNTAYDIYIQNDCSGSGNGSSIWDGPFTFTTECAAVNAPYTNNFDLDVLDEAPDCWDYYETYSGAYVEVEDLNTAYSGNQTLLLYNSYGDMPDDTLLAISPKFGDITAGDKMISFYSQVSDAGVSLIVGTMPSALATNSLHPLDTFHYNQIDTYQKFVLYLNTASGYNGTDKFLYFMHGGEITYEDIDIDDFVYDFAPACIPPLPNSLGVTAVTYSAADVTWGTSEGNKTYINWGAPAFIPGFTNGAGIDSVVGNIDTYTISGLSGQTTYEFYVRDSCAADGLSPWVGPFTFTTSCAPLAAPFTETFESTSSSRECWVNDRISGFNDWTFDEGSTGGAISAAYNGLLNAQFTSTSDGGTTRLVSPMIDVQSLTLPFLSFYYGQEIWSSDQNELTVYVRAHNDSNWIQIFHSDADVATWTLAEAVIPHVSDTIQLAFEGVDNFGRANVLDDIKVIEGPSCPDISNLYVSDVIDTAAILSWQGNVHANSYEVWFGPQGFYQGTATLGGTKIITANDSLLIDTLSPTSCYEFAVRGICSPGDTSAWTSVSMVFCTPCPSYTATYFENFDGTLSPDVEPCWTVINQTSSTYSSIETYDGTSPAAFSGSNSIEFYNSGAASGDMILVSPYLSDMDNSKHVRLKVYDESANSGDIIIGTLGNPADPATFTPFDTITEAEMEDDVWQEVRLFFGSYTGTDKYIGIKYGINGTYDYFYIDDFIYEAISCLYPSDFQATGNSPTSINLSWTTGGASNWQIEYGPAGFVPGTGIMVATSTNPFTLSGLTPGTVYDIYVRDSCAVGDVSLWTGPLMKYTDCTPLAAGTYTIGATGDFASFTEVSDALNICGVTGPVVFNIQPGTYTDRLYLRGLPGIHAGVPGVSSVNTITFNGSGNDVLIWNQQGPQATVLIDSTSHVTLNNMVIGNPVSSEGWGVLISNNSDSVTISNSIIWVDSTSTSSDLSPILISDDYENDLGEGAGVDYLTVTNSTLIGGYYGMNLEGNGTNDFSMGHSITNNHIRDFVQSGVYLDDIQELKIINNHITSARGADGIYAIDVNDFVIEQNYINVDDYGLYVNDGNDGYTPASRSRVINNMVVSTGDYAIYLNDVESIDVFHNTTIGEPGMAINDDETLDIRNNIFTSTGDFAFESFDAIDAGVVIDYNLYYSTATNAFDIGADVFVDLAAWKTDDATRNVNSFEGNPIFVSPTDLHVYGSFADNSGDNTVGITVDIDGDPRPAAGSTTVDMGADEFDAVLGDLALIFGDFKKNSYCLNTNDTVIFQVRNVIGSTADFVNTPLDLIYTVTGPVNSAGLINHSTGTLVYLDTLDLQAVNIDLSVPGTYTLNAFIDTNASNVLSQNDTLASVTIEVRPMLAVDPKTVTLMSAMDSVEVRALSPFLGGGDFFISEVSHYVYSTGAPTGGWPAYLEADDYIEITGIPGSDLGGITLEQWSNTTLMGTHTFPPNTLLSPNGTAIIAVGQLTSSIPSPTDFYYHGNGTYTGNFSSSGDNGRILKDANGVIIDAVGYGDGFSFPAASGVTVADWSGTLPVSNASSGNRLVGADVNSATNWVNSDGNPQDPNMANAGVTVPVAKAPTGFAWTHNGIQVDTAASMYVGPITTPGTYYYVASFSSPCGLLKDSVEVIVPGCYPPDSLWGSALSTSSVGVAWDTTGMGGAVFEIEYGPTGYIPGSGTVISASVDSVTITALAANLCQDYYVRTVCSSNGHSPWSGPINICPEETTCDDIEQYMAGSIEGQSSLFLGWEGDGGDAEVSGAQSAGGTNSIHIYEGGAEGFSDIVAYFDTIGSGAWSVYFDMYVSPGKAGYFGIQQNHALNGINNQWAGNVYFRANGIAEVDNGSATADTFSYAQGQWIGIRTIIDLDADTTWYEYNGNTTGAGFDYSVFNPGEELQFNGVNFWSGVLGSDQSDYYIDNFCINPYFTGTCPAPTALTSSNIGCDSVELSWTSLNTGSYSVLEYGPAGFVPGTGAGTIASFVQSPYVISGLTPGTAYDFYVADTCASDTSAIAGPVSFTTAAGPLPVASFVATANSFTVNVDGTASTGANSYSWDFGDGNTATGVSATNIYATGGSQTIVLTVSNACGTDDTTITLTNVSLEENPLSRSLKVYPNPSNDVVNISFATKDVQTAVIRLLDISGREILSIRKANLDGKLDETIDISHLADGVYMLSISDGNNIVNRRLIKN